MENVTYEQIRSHLDKELELNGLGAPDELQISNVTQHATQQNPEKPNPIHHHCKKPGDYRNQCCQLKREKDEAENNKNGAGSNDNNKNGGQKTITPTISLQTMPTQTIQTAEPTEKLNLSGHLVRVVVNSTMPQRNVTLQQRQIIDRVLGTDGLKNRTRSNKEILKTIRIKIFKLQLRILTRNASFRFGGACDRPETIETTKLPPIPEVEWQQPA